MDAARPGLGGKHMPDYLRLLTLAKDEGDVWKGKTNTAIRGSRNGSTGSTMIAQCLAAANTQGVNQVIVREHIVLSTRCGLLTFT
jgi:hypothetical protein